MLALKLKKKTNFSGKYLARFVKKNSAEYQKETINGEEFI
jgi:hypothetical protein